MRSMRLLLLPPGRLVNASLRAALVMVWLLVLCGAYVATSVVSSPLALADASCTTPVNTIVAENCLPGTPQTTWDVPGSGDPSIQGFATDISVNIGGTVQFKIATSATEYTIDIYRLGYYGGLGARKITSITPSATLPQSQPSCLTDASTGLVDCGNWGVSASWTVPSTAVSGVYFALLTRTDTDGKSQIVFVVRDDASHAEVVFKTSDTTWQAYNQYGGNSLYSGQPLGRAVAVSYNRPFDTRNTNATSFIFNAEYPMIRWLEANGYDVSYISSVDADRSGALLQQHTVILSVGHDEYWSAAERQSFQAARDAGVNLAFFSGNELYWKIRFENSVDGSNTPYRTIVCYKESANSNWPTDPADPSTATSTWRDARFGSPADAGMPENALTGQMFMVNGEGSSNLGAENDPINVPAASASLRFWRNTSIASLAPGTVATLPAGVLGYEWDEDVDNEYQPAGLIRLSATTLNVPYLVDDPYGTGFSQGSATHHLTLYRASSGALVFGAGTVQWSWGLDATHDRAGTPTSPDMKQATVNLLADMHAQPGSLQAGLVSATASTDTTPPTSQVTAPAANAQVAAGTSVIIAGTAQDTGGGVVAGVEVSVDGGTTWYHASGTTNWTYTWVPQSLGTATILSRATDDSGNIEATLATGISINVTSCTVCSLWSTSTAPVYSVIQDNTSYELGLKFSSDQAGWITGVRFYKGTGNIGTHLGHLWDSAGHLLAAATFTNESATGWQQVLFATPVAIQANATYVVSYYAPFGNYALERPSFSTARNVAPLHALSDGTNAPNGVYLTGMSGFPNGGYQASNYWVDVLFSTVSPTSDTTPPQVVTKFPNSGSAGIGAQIAVQAGFTEPLAASTVSPATFTLKNASNQSVAATVTYDPVTLTARLVPAVPLGVSSYTATLIGGSSGIKDLAGNPLPSNVSWTFNVSSAADAICPCSLWSSSTQPSSTAVNDTTPYELGVRFESDEPGWITGVRFYKGTGNTGTHVGHLWDSAGHLLAAATFTNESATGWQQVTFATPVAIQANTVYTASYWAPDGYYAQDRPYFDTQYDAAPLHALAGANGVFLTSASEFPQESYNASNYWVDVVFSTTP